MLQTQVFKYYAHLIMLILAFVTWGLYKCHAEDLNHTNAPQIESFALNPSSIGPEDHNVNLFSGDVNLPINLVSLPGRNGLNASVTITYNSNVHTIVGTRNLEAPTGILGFGWSLNSEKIIVDHKNTGTRADDDFYLVAGGASNLLVRAGDIDDNPRLYMTKKYQFWRIKYYYDTEKWEIIDENGIIKTFGGITGDDGDGNNSSQGNSVQWAVKWGNWIGSSSLTRDPDDATVRVQQQIAIEWNLYKVSDQWGNDITYEYTNVEQCVGQEVIDNVTHTGLKHTEASYLTKITDFYGRYIKFIYTHKEVVDEYQEPHIEQAPEPDAFQERYEKQYLNYLEVYNVNNDKEFTIDLSYDANHFIDSGTENVKRVLTSIEHIAANNEVLPDIKFEYLNSGDNKGALECVTYPSGGKITYSYKKVDVRKSSRAFTIDAPEGCSTPDVTIADDYAVVAWKTGQCINLSVYSWEGRWIKYEYPDLIGDAYEENNAKNFTVRCEADFFSIAINFGNNDGFTKTLYLFHKTNLKPGDWHAYKNSDSGFCDNGVLVAQGERFSTIISEEYGNMKIFTWNGNTWDIIEKSALVDVNDANFAITGKLNYYIVHNDEDDWTRFNYLDECNNWIADISMPLVNSISESMNHWYSGNSFAIWIAHNNPEVIYWWNDDLNNFSYQKIDGIHQVRDNAKVTISQNQINIFDFWYNEDYGPRQTSDHYRFTGKTWSPRYFNYHTNNLYMYYCFGDGILMEGYYDRSTENYYLRSSSFDPNTLLWSTPTGISHGSHFAVQLGLNDYISGDKFYYKETDGTFVNQTISLYDPHLDLTEAIWMLDSDTQNSRLDRRIYDHGINYIKYYISPDYTALPLLKNGKIYKGLLNHKPGHNYDEPYSLGMYNNKANVAGKFMFETHNGTKLSTSTQVKLHRVVRDHVKGVINDYPVQFVAINNGINTSTIRLGYNTTTATSDPTSTYAQYNEVKVSPVSDDSYGYTKHYFFNGLSRAELTAKSSPEDELFPPNDTYTNADDYYGILTGSSYLTKTFKKDNSQDNEISSTKNFWCVFKKQLGMRDQGYYARIKKIEAINDNIPKTTSFLYNHRNGQVSKVIENNTDKMIDGELCNVARVTDIEYAFDKYGIYPSVCAYWKFDEGFNNKVYDEVNNLEGEHYNQILLWNEGGIFGSCLEFHEGSFYDPTKTDAIWNKDVIRINNVDNNFETTFNDAFSFTAWIFPVKESDRELNDRILTFGGRRISIVGHQYKIKEALEFSTGSYSTTIKSSYIIPLDTWTHITMVGTDNGNDIDVIFYINGIESGSGNSPDPGNDYSDVELGYHYGNSFVGKMDEVIIFNEALTADQALDLYLNNIQYVDILNDPNFSPFAYKNFLSNVYSKTTKEKLNDDGIVKAKQWSTWKESGSEIINDEQYVWKNDVTGAEVIAPLDPRTSDDIKVIKYDSYDTYGNLLQVSDNRSTSVSTTTIWGYDNALPIAIIKNATKDECLADDFGDNDLTDDTPLDWYTTSLNWEALSQKLEYTNNSSHGMIGNNSAFAALNNDFIAEFDVIMDESDIGTGSIRFLFCKNNSTHSYSTSGCYLLYNSNGGLFVFDAGNEMPLGSASSGKTLEQWRHVKLQVKNSRLMVNVDGKKEIDIVAPTTYSGEYFSLHAENGRTTFDNFRIYPADALAVSTSYDPFTFKKTEQIDENGVRTFIEYDCFGRLINVKNNKGILLAEKEHVYSRDITGDDNFSLYMPNYDRVKLYPENLNGVGLAEPLVTDVFYDAINREIQTQHWNGDNVIVTKTTYNPIGKIARQYQPREVLNPSHLYVEDVTAAEQWYYSDFIPAGDKVSLVAHDEIILEAPFHAEAGSKFSARIDQGDIGLHEKFEYEYSPQGRLLTQRHADYLTINKYEYGAENGFQISTFINEKGNKQKLFLDKLGNQVESINSDKDDNILTKWTQVFDNWGSVTNIYPPNAYNSAYIPTGETAEYWKNIIEYNTLGEQISNSTIDEGTTRYMYDKHGNIRFIQNAAQRAESEITPGKFSVYRYDIYNRLISIGKEHDNLWNDSNTPDPNSDEYALDTDIGEWIVKYTYDENQVLPGGAHVQNYCCGRLTMVEKDDNGDGVVDHRLKFVYDYQGNIVEKHTTVDINNGTPAIDKVMKIKYDQLGREVEINYPSGLIIYKTYDNVGRLEKVIALE